jgi:hypothetical protein
MESDGIHKLYKGVYVETFDAKSKQAIRKLSYS